MAEISGKKTGGRWGKSLRRVVCLAVLLLVLIHVGLWLGQRLLVFPGAYVSHAVDQQPPGGVEVWTRDTDEGAVEAWVMPGRGATAERPGAAVVFCHGNGELINIWAEEMRWYTQRGYTVLLPEYRGYGRSEGSPSQIEIVEDATHFYDRLAALPSVDAQRIVYHGRSLGGGVVAQLAAVRKPAAMILASTFTSIPDVALGPIPVPRFMIRDPFPVESVLKQYTGPVLILHGEKDQAVPVEFARHNAAAAENATLVIYAGINHNDMPHGHGKWDDILAFLERSDLPWRLAGEVAAPGQ